MTMTEEQILEQQRSLDEQQKRLDEALQQARADEVVALRETVARMADKRGMTFAAFIQEHLGKEPPRKSAPQRGVAPARYVSPNDPTVTWSGKGPQPAWFTAAIAEGFTRSMMEIVTPSRANGNGAHA